MKKLLMIDEDVTQLENFKLFLKRANDFNYLVKYASSPLEGLAAYHLFLPDFIFIGFSLPLAEKMALLKQISRSGRQTKIISLSQQVWMDFVQGITEGCADAYLEKPVSESAFLSCLNKLIS